MAAIWLAAVNLAGFILMGVDKSRAKRDAWRIPEKTLFLTAILVVQLVAVGWLLSR